ncbi:hypothetical protein PROFUN_02093 [Planoprotostelium fungivorum]|uniref:Uncharacterized protein n=1 Tax=Planoprotostelium fungivorum TaxID=1890364 RepID=A0A2P6NZ54_9EUKA|nr:hypothetical protein PROFUN_02093 [Planoprotostelium fungivorum]
MLQAIACDYAAVFLPRKPSAQMPEMVKGMALRSISERFVATKKHIQCTFIERELLGFLWFEIILYKQRLIELFGSYVVTIHHN